MLSTPNSTELLKKKRRRRIAKLILFIIFFLVIIYGISFWSYYPKFQVIELEVEGVEFSDEQMIRDIFEKNISGRKMLVLSQRNFLFIPKSEIINELKDNMVIEDAEIVTRGFDRVVIKIKEFAPVAVWCKEDCYFINQKGEAFVKAPLLYEDYLVVLKRETEGDLFGQQYSDEKVFQNIFKFIDLMKNLNVEITSVSTGDEETYALLSNSYPELLIDKNDQPENIFSNLNTILEKDAINEAQLGNIEYIDLRFGNKVYYKIK